MTARIRYIVKRKLKGPLRPLLLFGAPLRTYLVTDQMTLSVEDYFSVGDFLQVFPAGTDSDCHAPAGELTFSFPCWKLHSPESQHLCILSRVKFFSWHKIPNPSHKNSHRSFLRKLYGRIFHFYICLHFVLLVVLICTLRAVEWWNRQDSNLRPADYASAATNRLSYSPMRICTAEALHIY